jgi:hypothetical protein
MERLSRWRCRDGSLEVVARRKSRRGNQGGLGRAILPLRHQIFFSFLSRSREPDVIHCVSLFLSERIYVSKFLSLLPHRPVDCFVRCRRARVG